MNKQCNDIIKLYKYKQYLKGLNKTKEYELLCKLEKRNKEELVMIAFANCQKLIDLGEDYEPVYEDVK